MTGMEEGVLTVAGLIGGIFHDDIRLLVLEFTQRQEDDIALIDPDLQWQPVASVPLFHLCFHDSEQSTARDAPSFSFSLVYAPIS